MDEFIGAYFQEIKVRNALKVIDNNARAFNEAVVYMMSPNHPELTNEQAFYGKLEELTGVSRDVMLPAFDEFYEKYYDNIQVTSKADPRCREAIKTAKAKGYRLVLATNPVFPCLATDKRIAWAGLDKEDFSYISYFNNTHFCKPDLRYFEEILEKLELDASECLSLIHI